LYDTSWERKGRERGKEKQEPVAFGSGARKMPCPEVNGVPGDAHSVALKTLSLWKGFRRRGEREKGKGGRRKGRGGRGIQLADPS